MPNSVLNQLKALRDGVAQDLRKDPRYLTLQALDKSIEEVTAVLSASGLVAPAPAPSLTQRLSGLAPQADRYAEPVAALAASEPAGEPAEDSHGEPARPHLGFKDGTAGSPPPVVPHSLFAPSLTPALDVAGAAAIAASIAEAVEPVHEAHAEAHDEFHHEPPAAVDAPHSEAAPAEDGDATLHEEPIAHAGTIDHGEPALPSVENAGHDVDESYEHEADGGVSHHQDLEASAEEAVAEPEHDASIQVESAAELHHSEVGHELAAPLLETVSFESASDESGPPEDRLTADLEAALEEMAAVTASPSTEPNEDEAVLHDAGLDTAPAHAAAESAGLEEAASEPATANFAALEHREPGPQELDHTGLYHTGVDAVEFDHAELEPAALDPTPVEHAAEAGPARDEPVYEETVHEETVLEETASEPAGDEAVHVLEPALAPELESAAANDPAFETIAADAIAAALFAGDEPAFGVNEDPSPAPVLAETGSHEIEDHAALEDEAGPVDSVTALGEDAVATALFSEDEPALAQHEEDAAPSLSEAAELHQAEEHVGTLDEAAAEPALDGTPIDGTPAAIGEDAVAAALFSGEPEADEEPSAIEAPNFEGIEDAIAAALLADEPVAEAPAPVFAERVIPEGKASGYIPLPAKPGAAHYSPSIAVKFGKLPARVDLRPLLGPVEDQGERQSAVAHAVAAAYEYWLQKATKKPQRISRAFIDYNARWRAGVQDRDAGSAIQLALEGLQRFGACPENAWPLHPGLLSERPGAQAYRDAAPFRVHDMAQVPLKLESWKQALAEGKPIVFGLVVFETFAASTAAGGIVAMPSPDEVPHAARAIHALCAVGYNDAEKVFIVRNSWGADFGDKGYVYIPYDYVTNPKFNDGDAWIFVPKVPSQPPREAWNETQEPVANGGEGVDFAIPSYPAAEYAGVNQDFFEAARQSWPSLVPDDYSIYASKVAKSQFDELAPFDVTSFLDGHPVANAGAGPEGERAPVPLSVAESDEWGEAASWGVSTAIDHDRSAVSAGHENDAKAEADAELTE